MVDILKIIKEKAQKAQKRIILTEANDHRVLEAVQIITKERLAKVVLTGNKANIERKARFHKINLDGIEVVDAKDLTAALKLLKDGVADGMVAGATMPTAELYKAAFKVIGTKKDEKASTFFLMALGNKSYVFADCALNIEPDEHLLSEIAIQSYDSAKDLGIIPRVAMLSFSTNGSAKHSSITKVAKATKLVQKKRKDILIDGEMQADAAIVPIVAKQKNEKSPIRGNATVLIFPDLNSGNIAYKLVERLAGANAIGPITQGLKKPVNDLSRGCSVSDIVYSACITALQATKEKP